jgi:hypothetical protein
MASAPGLVRRGRGVWFVGFALAALLVGVAFVLEQQAIHEAQATAKSAQLAADARSHEAVIQVDRSLKRTSLQHALPQKVRRDVDQALKKVLAGQVGVAVRVWSPSGVLRYSTLERDASTPDRSAIRDAADAKAKSVTAIDGGIMTTYRSIGSSGAAVEIVQPDPSYRAPDPGLLGFARGAGLAVATIMLFLILAAVLLDRFGTKATASDGFGPSGARDIPSDTKGARKGKADPLAPAASPSVKAEQGPEPGMREKLTRSEQARQAMEVELGQARTQLKTDNERASARVKALEDQLGMTQARLQEALVAAEAAQEQAATATAEARAEAARSRDDDAPAVDDERVRALERELEAEQMRSGAAEARVKGLEAQLRQQAEAVEAAAASAAEGAVAASERVDPATSRGHSSDHEAPAADPELDLDRVAQLETDLAAALERAREAEDRAARLQDRLVELDPALAALESWVPPSGSAADEEGGESFRARLVRNAARRKAGEETAAEEGSQRAR